MDFSIAVLLAQDGITNGAIYALLSLALVLVFAVTRVIFVPAGRVRDLRNADAGCAAARQAAGHRRPAARSALASPARWRSYAAARDRDWRRLPRRLAMYLVVPLAIAALVHAAGAAALAFPLQILLAVAIVTALGPLLYRVAYQPLAEASVLVLLIVSVAVHFAMLGLGLWFFGAEGSRTPAFTRVACSVGDVPDQRAEPAGAAVLVAGHRRALRSSSTGRSTARRLRATALNRVGARLVGDQPEPRRQPDLHAGRAACAHFPAC